MATGYIDKYVFALMLDSTDFQKGANLATRAIGGLKSTLLKTYSAIGGIDLFKNLISTYTDAAKSVDRMSIVTNEDINSLQAWQKAISDTGGNVNAFNGTIRALSDDMAQLKNYGTSKYLSTMQWLGIDFTNEKGEIKSATELLLAYQKALAGMDNQTAWNFAQKLGLDEDTFALMRRHPDDLEKIIRQYKKISVIGKEDIAINRQWEKVLSDFRYSWLRFSKTIGSNVLPILQNQLFPAIQDGINYLLGHKEEISTVIDGLGEGVKKIIPVMKVVAVIAKEIGSLIWNISEATGDLMGRATGYLERRGTSWVSVLNSLSPLGRLVNGNMVEKDLQKKQNELQNSVALRKKYNAMLEMQRIIRSGKFDSILLEDNFRKQYQNSVILNGGINVSVGNGTAESVTNGIEEKLSNKLSLLNLGPQLGGGVNI